MSILERISDGLWSPWLLGLFLVCGLLFSLRSGFFQFFEAHVWLKTSLSGLKSTDKGFSKLQTLATALASTIGTGSIAGVATAIVLGGPGSIFWMWVCAFLGMMTGFVEKTLAVRYQLHHADGSCSGGPMRYMQKGLGLVLLPWLFSLFCALNSFIGGNMVQANSIATTLHDAFGFSQVAVGIVVALLCGVVILGGLGRIARVSEWLVPFMAVLYIGGSLVVLFVHRANLSASLSLIVREAFAPAPVVGGGLGYGIVRAMRYGVARGVFTNEAGLGSSAMVHAAAKPAHPAEEGFLGMLEVFFSTIVVCTMTALVILCSGVYDMDYVLACRAAGEIPAQLLGAPLTTAAFSTVFGDFGGIFISICLLCFAFTSLLGWSYYGERGLAHLCKSEKHKTAFRFVFLVCIFFGCIGDLTTIWLVSDILNGLMALPNLIVLISLSGEAFDALHEWKARHLLYRKRSLLRRVS